MSAVNVGGSGTLVALADTGASTSLLTRESAARIRLFVREAEVETEESKARRNSFTGTSTNSTPIQIRRPSGLPVFSAVSKFGESTPQEVVAGLNP